MGCPVCEEGTGAQNTGHQLEALQSPEMLDLRPFPLMLELLISVTPACSDGPSGAIDLALCRHKVDPKWRVPGPHFLPAQVQQGGTWHRLSEALKCYHILPEV